MKIINIGKWYDLPTGFTGIANTTFGSKGWFLNGRFHRLDGPAWIGMGGSEEFWVHGEQIRNETAFNLLTNMLKLKGLM